MRMLYVCVQRVFLMIPLIAYLALELWLLAALIVQMASKVPFVLIMLIAVGTVISIK